MELKFKKARRSYALELKNSRRRYRRKTAVNVEHSFGGGLSGNSQKLIRVGLVSSCLLLTAAIAGSVIIMRPAAGSKTNRSKVMTPSRLHAPTQTPGTDTRRWQDPEPREIALQFLAASTQQERLKLVRQPDKVSDIMETFFTEGPGSRENVAKVIPLTAGATGADSLSQFRVIMEDGSVRVLSVVSQGTGGAAVDFKSYARWCSVSWDALLGGSATKADEMRVSLRPDTYYNLKFADESKWQCLEATSPDLDTKIYLYASRANHRLHGALRDLAEGQYYHTLAIESLGDSHRHRQFVLTHVLHAGWLGE